MKKTVVLLACAMAGLSALASEKKEYNFLGELDLTHQSNHAPNPTEINGGKYQITVSIKPLIGIDPDELTVQAEAFSDDGRIECVQTLSVPLAAASVVMNDLNGQWTQVVYGPLMNAQVGISSAVLRSEDCKAKTQDWIGLRNVGASFHYVSVQLPVVPPKGYDRVMMYMNIFEGGSLNFPIQIVAGKTPNTVKVINPGLALNQALEVLKEKSMVLNYNVFASYFGGSLNLGYGKIRLFK